jgi:pimeloyl-ACP methyl ester carboxylesterase
MLTSDHRVVNSDRRSFGRSANAPLANLRRHTQDAAGILESLNQGPSTVVGWGFGGLIAVDLAATRPDLVSGPGNASAILRELDSGTGERELGKGALSTVRCPVRWLYGDRSAPTFEASARRAQSHIAQVPLVRVARAGHVMQFDRPDAVAEAVRYVATAART